MILPDSVAIKTVATTPTVYGIETDYKKLPQSFLDLFKLQQHLPFTVLKLETSSRTAEKFSLGCNNTYRLRYWNSINSLRL